MTGIERLRSQAEGGTSPNVVIPRPMLRDIARQIEAESGRRARRPEAGGFASDVCLAFGAAMAALVACYALVSVAIHAGWPGVAALAALSVALLCVGLAGRAR